MKMFSAVLLLNYNNYQDTINCIESILKYNTAPVKFVVVDNGSQESRCIDSLDRYFRDRFHADYQMVERDAPLISELPETTFIISRSNEGYARGNNLGLRFIFEDESIDDVLVINNDILFVKDIIPVLKEMRTHLDRCGIISPLLYGSDYKSIEYNCARKAPTRWEVILPFVLMKHDLFRYISRSSARQKLLKTRPELIKEDYFPIEMPSGSCMLICKDLFKSIQGFDPKTFLYYEENILYAKTAQRGLVNYCVPGVECIHIGGASTHSASSSFLQRCNVYSADHYLHHYCKMTVMEMMIWRVAKSLFLVKINCMDFLRGRR